MIKKILYVIGGLIIVLFLIGYFVQEATSPPKIKEIKFADSMNDGIYKSGDKITIIVSFSDPVVVDFNKEKPIIMLETGKIDRFASYHSGSNTKNLIFEYIIMTGDNTIVQELTNYGHAVLSQDKDFFTSSIKNNISFTSSIKYIISRVKSIVLEIPIIGPRISILYRKSIFYPHHLNLHDHRLRLLKQKPYIILASPDTIKGKHNSVNAVLDFYKGIIFNYEFPLRDHRRILVDSSSTIHWKYHMISGNNPTYCNARCSPILMLKTKKAEQIFAIDLDSDGDIDIISASYDSGIAWHENNGNKSFQSHKITNKLKKARTVQAADIDNDGDIDIIAGGRDQIVWFENKGNNNFIIHEIINSEGLEVSQVFPIDLDDDGDQDIIAAIQWKNVFVWYENTNSNNFIEHKISDNAIGAHDIFAIDLDQDSDLDLVFSSFGDHTVGWYENDGSQRFTQHIITTSAKETTSVYAIDLDKDGDIDVLSDAAANNAIIWFENNGEENFTSHNITMNANRAYDVFPTDLDNDGDIDVISAASYDHKIEWYENDGMQNFEPHIITTQAIHASSVYAADLDNDGDIDVVSSSAGDSSIKWFENQY